MKKNIVLIPLLALLVTSCGNHTHSNPIKTEENTSQITSNIEVETSSKSSENSHENTTQNPNETTPTNSSETTSENVTENSSETSSEISSETQGQTSDETTFDTSSESTDETTTNEPEIPHHPTHLPNGAEWLDGPKNLANPIDISKMQSFNVDYGIPDNWSYIYGNNKTQGDWYVENNTKIALKFADSGRGLQTPAFTSSNRMEIELLATEFHGTDVKRSNAKKDTFLLYGFNEFGELVETQYTTPFEKGVDKKRKQPLKIEFYIENPEVRYAEIRLNDRLFNNEQTQKYVNFGVSEMSLIAYK